MKKTFLVFVSLFFVVSCNNQSNKKADLYENTNISPEEKVSLEQRKLKILKMEKVNLEKDQIDRKLQTITFCEKAKIPVLDSLPSIESEKTVKIRTTEEIVERALALAYLGIKSEGAEKADLDKFEQKYQITKLFTKKENEFVLSDAPTEQQKVDANWRYESLHVLLWSLGYIDRLAYPDTICNVADDIEIIATQTREQFLNGAKLRTKKEILDQADLTYRLNWAVVNARVKGQETPARLYPSIVYERHYSLNWLTNYMKADWDNVSTDT